MSEESEIAIERKQYLIIITLVLLLCEMIIISVLTILPQTSAARDVSEYNRNLIIVTCVIICVLVAIAMPAKMGWVRVFTKTVRKFENDAVQKPADKRAALKKYVELTDLQNIRNDAIEEEASNLRQISRWPVILLATSIISIIAWITPTYHDSDWRWVAMVVILLRIGGFVFIPATIVSLIGIFPFRHNIKKLAAIHEEKLDIIKKQMSELEKILTE